MTTGRPDLVWDTLRQSVRCVPAGRCGGGPAGRTDLRGCRRRRRPQRLRPPSRERRRAGATHNLQRQRPVGASARVLPRRLAAGGGTPPWVALWDMRDPAAPRRLAIWHSNVGEPSALAVLDDGRVLAGTSTTQLAVWNALGDGSSRARWCQGVSQLAVQHFSADASGEQVLIDYPSFDATLRRRHRHRHRVGTYSAADPSAPASTLPPVSWTSSLSLDGSTVASFDLAGRGFVFDTADGHLVTTLTGGHTSLVADAYFNDAGLLSPRASTARCGCGTRTPRTPTSREALPTTCAGVSAAGSTPTAGSSPSRTTTSTYRARRPRRRRPHRSRCRARPTSGRCRR